MTLSAPKPYIFYPNIAEVTTTLRAIKFIRDLVFQMVILEGDVLTVV